MADGYVLARFSGVSDPTIWVYQAEQYFSFYGFSKVLWLSLPYLYFDRESLAWFNWLYRNNKFYDWKDFTKKLACHYSKLTITEPGLSPVIDLLLQMDENFSRMRSHLDKIQSTLFACSQKFVDAQARFDLTASLADKCEIEEVAEPYIVYALDEDDSNHTYNSEVLSKTLQPPIDVEQEKLEGVDNYLSLGHLKSLPMPTKITVEDNFATDEKNEAATCLEGGEHHLFDEFPQRTELIYLHSKLLHSQLDPLTDFGDLAMCESMKNILPTRYWFDTGQLLPQPISFVFQHKKCGSILSVLEFYKLVAFDAQGGSVIIIVHDETSLFGDAHRKYMWLLEFVSMGQSTRSAQTHPRCQRIADCLMIFDKIPQRCIVCWIGSIEVSERAENFEGVFSLFFFIQLGYVIFGKILIVLCNVNPFLGMDFNCGGSAMFSTSSWSVNLQAYSCFSTGFVVYHTFLNLPFDPGIILDIPLLYGADKTMVTTSRFPSTYILIFSLWGEQVCGLGLNHVSTAASPSESFSTALEVLDIGPNSADCIKLEKTRQWKCHKLFPSANLNPYRCYH